MDPSQSVYVRRRGRLIASSIVLLFVPFGWPATIYIAIKLWQTRKDVPPRAVPPITGEGWVGPATSVRGPVAWSTEGQTTQEPVAQQPVDGAITWAQPTDSPSPAKSTRPVVLLVSGLVILLVAGTIALTLLGNQADEQGVPSVGSGTQSALPPPCVLVMDGPLGRMAFYTPRASVSECAALMASARDGFGPDSASSSLYLSHDVPTGAPACVVGVTQVFTYGSNAETYGAQVCAAMR